eukprot:317009-Prorocentrum_minimum.AAC.6
MLHFWSGSEARGRLHSTETSSSPPSSRCRVPRLHSASTLDRYLPLPPLHTRECSPLRPPPASPPQRGDGGAAAGPRAGGGARDGGEAQGARHPRGRPPALRGVRRPPGERPVGHRPGHPHLAPKLHECHQYRAVPIRLLEHGLLRDGSFASWCSTTTFRTASGVRVGPGHPR